MLHRSFNRGLQRLIKKVEWPMYIVNVDRNFRCSCLDKRSNQGKPECPLCLGTGYRIKVREVKAVKQPYTSSNRGGGTTVSLQGVANVYYMSAKEGEAKLGDFMVHGNEIDVIKYVRKFRTDSPDLQFYEMPAVLKKYENERFLDGLKKILKKSQKKK